MSPRPSSQTPDTLGAFEQLVLLALVRLGEQAYGMSVRVEIAEQTGREPSLGAVYSTLDRLERKGLVGSHAGPASGPRAGRARRFFRIEGRGRRALQVTLDSLDRMRAGAPGLAPPAPL